MYSLLDSEHGIPEPQGHVTFQVKERVNRVSAFHFSPCLSRASLPPGFRSISFHKGGGNVGNEKEGRRKGREERERDGDGEYRKNGSRKGKGERQRR